jgi:hypothetical protein
MPKANQTSRAKQDEDRTFDKQKHHCNSITLKSHFNAYRNVIIISWELTYVERNYQENPVTLVTGNDLIIPDVLDLYAREIKSYIGSIVKEYKNLFISKLKPEFFTRKQFTDRTSELNGNNGNKPPMTVPVDFEQLFKDFNADKEKFLQSKHEDSFLCLQPSMCFHVIHKNRKIVCLMYVPHEERTSPLSPCTDQFIDNSIVSDWETLKKALPGDVLLRSIEIHFRRDLQIIDPSALDYQHGDSPSTPITVLLNLGRCNRALEIPKKFSNHTFSKSTRKYTYSPKKRGSLKH